MDSIKLEFEGMNELEAKFAALSTLDRLKFFSEVFSPIANRIVREMQDETPVSKEGVKSRKYASRSHPAGTLKKSIGKQLGGTDIPTVWVSLNRKKNADAWYQHIVVGGHEYGGSQIAPNPIVRRTWDKMTPWLQSQLKSKLSNKLKAMVQ